MIPSGLAVNSRINATYNFIEFIMALANISTFDGNKLPS